VLILALSGEIGPSSDSLLWGTLAGASGVAGAGFFYLALARGTMGVVAPLAAVIGAGLPVFVLIVGGETASPGRLVGIAMALAAVVLISIPGRPRDQSERRALKVDLGELPLIVLTGIGFAGFFLGMDRASAGGATWWPLVFVRLAGFGLVTVAFIVLLMRRRGQSFRARVDSVLGLGRLRATGRSMAAIIPLFVVMGLGDMGGNAFFVLAGQADVFSVAIVLSSLYPVITALLAAIFLRERLSPVQIAGVVLATLSFPLLR
jgi:drug/metabolite transporter (DMT)-like permease